MLRDRAKFFLFLSSYIPLYAIIALRNLQHPYLVYGLIGLSVFLLVVIVGMVAIANRGGGRYYKFDKIENANKTGLEYFVFYIVPFLSINFLNIPDVASILLLFAIMAFMYIRSDLLYLNPMLAIFSFNIYKATWKQEEVVLITKRKLRLGLDNQEFIPLSEGVLLGLKPWQEPTERSTQNV